MRRIHTDRTSPNWTERSHSAAPSLLVFHYTGMRSAEEAINRLCDPESGVSAHYVIDEQGEILQLVKDRYRAWHAGVSYWKGERDINSHSIGIELVNPGHEFGYRDFPDQQIDALIELSLMLMEKHQISSAGILAHSDIAPARKQDPGELFPWGKTAGEGVGILPVPEEEDQNLAKSLFSNQEACREVFTRIGYDPEADFADVLMAFRQRYDQALFGELFEFPPLSVNDMAKAVALERIIDS